MLNLLATNGSAVINVIALLFVIGFALYGLIRGFAGTFISMFGTILSILFAILLCPVVTSFLESNHSFVTTMSKSLSKILTNIFGKEVMGTTIEAASKESMKNLGLNSLIINLVLALKKNATLPTNTTLSQIICPTFAYYVVLIISAIGLFIVFKLIFIVLAKITRKFYNINLIEKPDRTLGFFLGLISGVIYFETIVMLIGAIPLGFTQDLYALIYNSSVANFICLINPYDSILSLLSFGDITNFISKLIIN